MSDAAQATYTRLQSLIWPDAAISSEITPYVRPFGPCELSSPAGPCRLERSGRASFATWFNLFNLGVWRKHCDLTTLYLELAGRGRVSIAVTLTCLGAIPILRMFEVDLTQGAPVRLDLAEFLELSMSANAVDKTQTHASQLLVNKFENLYQDPTPTTRALLSFEIQCIDQIAVLTDAAWVTGDPVVRRPDLSVVLTTFQREEAATRTMERFAEFRQQSPLRDALDLMVVDNGGTIKDPKLDGVRVFQNANLGGAGGFSRGVIEATDAGASHCVFMDDDASMRMESFERIWMMLAYASDPATAVVGAMINGEYPHELWENGAVFDLRCMPQYMGVNLRSFEDTAMMEAQVTQAAPQQLYGGWWLFAFPIKSVKHMPFPFFVRGDDISFCLANTFDLVRLNGVASFQEAFTSKESPLTWYLDLRSHLVHHYSLATMAKPRWAMAYLAIWFYLRNLPGMHYETMTAINLALEDVLQGPSFFDVHADMAQRRKDIKALTKSEAWQPVLDHSQLPAKRMILPSPFWLWVMKLTLNGHILPFYRRLAQRFTFEAQHRGSIVMTWGAAEITYLSEDGTQMYRVRHSKRAALREAVRMSKSLLKLLLRHDALKAEYQATYDQMTNRNYWMQKLHLQNEPISHAEAAE